MRKKALSAQGIIKELELHREKMNQLGVKQIGLFGSFLKGKQGPKSDLDFLVVLEEHTFDNYMDLKFFLEELFGRKVDLVMKESLKPALHYVEEEALYAKIA